MLSIPAMPDLWDVKDIIVSHEDVAGALAKCAVLQSPYATPHNLAEAINEFLYYWPYRELFTVNGKTLSLLIRTSFACCKHIREWEKPKKHFKMYALYTDDEFADPDYHFISLDALARNVAHDIILDWQVRAAQDEYREKKRTFSNIDNYWEQEYDNFYGTVTTVHPEFPTFPLTPETDRGSTEIE
jgi:hypothetical protein